MKNLFLFIILIVIYSCNIQPKSTLEDDKISILKVMTTQEIAWSLRDLDGFMEGYHQSDSLKFYGKSGLTKGWQQTLDNYKKGYPSKDHSGSLNFEIIDISPIENQSYWVMGKYFLSRNVGDANGVFMVIFKKIEGEWKIVADMSCG
ncbi:MAG: nuclear transport factor 2 family protein [Flavobacteriaceae bacterium]|jgi:hypothetical protein|nr:nuclear transport factor 2 family protein [Flavobacteriaceae bacterium]